MKVLHINQHLAWAGGVETYLLSLLPRLTEAGHPQAFAYANGSPDLVDEAVPLATLAQASRAAEASGFEEMNAVLNQVRPDLVHLHQAYNMGALRACLERVPVIVHAHDFRYVCPSSTFYYKRTREVCQRTAGLGCFATTLSKHCLTPRPRYALDYYRRVRWFAEQRHALAGVIAPSEAARARYLAAGFAPGQVSVLPYFCPIKPAEQPRPLPTHPTVLFMGRIRPSKGVDVLVEAVALLPERVRAILVGDFTEESRAEVLRQAERLGCAGRIECRGWADRDVIRATYEEATVFAFPSLWMETLGIVGIEALACGVPVVASDIGGVREWLIDGETGFLARPKSATELAAGLQRLLEDADLNYRMGEKGVQLVREKFSPEGHVRQLLKLYEQALDQPAVKRGAQAH